MLDLPTGTVAFWTTLSAPTGWVLCDGAAISRADFAGLFAVIGTTYGAGDGSTTFNVPDLRGRFALGKAAAGTGSALGGTGGALDHVHQVDVPATTSGGNSTRVSITAAGAGFAAADGHTHSTNPAPFNSGGANPPFLVLTGIIRA